MGILNSDWLGQSELALPYSSEGLGLRRWNLASLNEFTRKALIKEVLQRLVLQLQFTDST